MRSILKVDALQKSDGTDGVHIAGTIIQHQYTHLPASGAANETETNGTSYLASGFSVTITPKYANSRILFMAACNIKQTINSSQTYLDLQVMRSISGGSVQPVDTGGSNNDMARSRIDGSTLNYQQLSLIIPDHPNTTSPVTYTIFIRNSGSNSNVMRIGENGSDEYCHVMEIAQ